LSGVEIRPGPAEDSAVVTAARGGDEAAFGGLAERYRPELRLHGYRMLGSLEESEDLVQETLLRAWRRRETFQGRSTFRAWMYRIATNACLDLLARRPREPIPRDMTPAREEGEGARSLPPAAIPWLQPYPDELLEPISPREAGPDALVIARETIELAFLVAIQQLPARQRAVLILRDVLGWSAKETAESLETSVAAVNSALQRARPTLRRHLPPRRLDWASPGPSPQERAVLQRYMEALERADDNALAEVLREDARVSHQAGAGGHLAPVPTWYQGREKIIESWAPALHGPHAAGFRIVPTRANGQPAAACYVRDPGGAGHRAFSLVVLRVEEGAVAEITVFGADLVAAFGLPPTL
jgi:RNA polymerase sigma-70 factor (ECF subfamily)